MTLRHVLVGFATFAGLAAGDIGAAPVTEQQARTAALAAIASHSGEKLANTSASSGPLRHIDTTTSLYHNGTRVGSVVSWQEGGFALMSTDDELPPCKLQSDHGKFDSLPPAFQKVIRLEMMQDLEALKTLHSKSKAPDPKYHEQWKQLLAGSATSSGTLGASSGTFLLTSTWNQDWPYNYYAPAADYGPAGRAYAGCVACAMAQILHYFRQPAEITRNFSYYDDKGFCTGVHQFSDTGLTNYDWTDMPDSITPASAVVQQRAIGQLMYHTGVAVQSDFEADGTGADPSVISGAFQNYFGFNCGPLEDKSSYSSAAWYNKIAADIDAHRPVFYGMFQADWSEGHAVVCDGYRNGNEIHLNLGWSGVDDAWYNIDTIEAEGIVWTIHMAVFGITPPNGTPANDQCAGAISLANGFTFNMNTAAATSTGDPVPGCASTGNCVWYKVTPTVGGSVTVTTCGSDFDTVLAVYSGACSALTSITCNDDAGTCGTGSTVVFNATAGTTYYILAAGKSSATGNLQITASWVVPAPANDQCSGAIPLSNGGSAYCDTSLATSTGDPAPGCAVDAANGVWYQVTPNAPAMVLLSTCGSDFDTVLSVYRGACGSLTPIACNDDDANCGTASRVTFPADPGVTYYILAAGYAGATGNLQIAAQWTVAAPVSNDQCDDAITLTNGQSIGANTWTATSTNDPLPSCATNCGKGVWYKFTPDNSRPVTVSTCGSDFNTVLAVYSGSCGALTELACNDNGATGCAAGRTTSLLTFAPTAGVTYYAFVAGINSAYGNLRVTVNWGPENDMFDDATVVTGQLISVQGSNIGATSESGEPNHGGVSSGKSVWWTWTAPTNALTGISTAGSSFDTVLAVYTGDSVGHLTQVAANNDISLENYSSRVSFNAVSGTTYHIAVDSASAQAGSISLIINAGSSAFVQRKAVYNGLFYSKDGAGFPSAGFITIATTTKGNLSGKAFIAGKSHPFSGFFSRTGSADPFIYQTRGSSYAVHLQLDPSDADVLTGQISDNSFVADIFADRATFNAATNPSPVIGKYTLALPASGDSALQPGGDGFATINVIASGAVTLAGALADGTKITQHSVLSKTAQLPFYGSLYSGQGSILGWLKFEEADDHDVSGTLDWFRPLVPAAKLYPAGFTNEMNAVGSKYQYQAGAQILNLQNASLNVNGGALANGFTNEVVLTGTKIVNESPNKLTLSISPSSGLISGSVVNPATGKSIPLKGILLQKQNMGCGYFTFTNQSGHVYLGQ